MPAGRSNASNLLQKVNSQLRGERVPIKSKEEDELAVYLQKLSQKTQEAQNVGFEDHGDISISSGADAMHTPRGRRSASPAGAVSKAAGSGSKFLKKKKPLAEEQSDEDEEKPGKEIIIKGKGKGAAQSSKSSVLHPVRTSALDKANALANKITSRAAGSVPLRRARSGGSDSEESIRGSDFGKRPGSADTSIGRDANRFLKSRKVAESEGHQGTRSPSPQLNYQRSVSVEKKETPRRSSKNKGEIVRTLGSVYLTSEEESLAEFIHGLSTSETSKKPQNLVAKRQQKWRKKSPSPAGRQSASPIHMSRSASPFKNRSPSPFGRLSRSQSQDSDAVDSMASEMLDDRQRQDDSISSDDNKFNVNLMDISSLIPVASSPDLGKNRKNKKARPGSAGNKSSSTSLFKASVPDVFKADRLTDSGKGSKKSVKSKKPDSKSKSNGFESLGIQMADDLFDDLYENDDYVGKEDSVSDDSEIVTEKSQDRNKVLQDSESEIITEIGSKARKAPFERQTSVDESISERLNERSSMGRIKMAYTSDEQDAIEAENEYSESFISESETVTPTISHRSRTRKKRVEDSYSQASRSSRRHRREHKVVMEEKRVDISATDDQGKTHFWNTAQTGISVSGPFGLQYVDPTPVASHVVSADALEAMTAYSPNMLALQDMMRSQLQLITSFMDIQRRIYHSCLDGLHEDHQYTTLENTKEYIVKNRKPRMTMDEALRIVDLEDRGVQ